MVEHSRYNIGGNEENSILKNKLGITDQKILEDTETILLADTYKHFLDLHKSKRLKFDLNLIFQIHKYFLNTLYTWAGKIRTVEISKDGILFCASSQIKKNLEQFEKIIKHHLPSKKDNKKTLSKKLSIIHCEFNAIHPFREGNGRTIRLFLDLLTINSGFSLLDYDKFHKDEYIKACIAGMHKEYAKIQKLIYKAIAR